MRNDLTDITFLLDRSGSMFTCKKDAEEGMNKFVEEQKKEPGECRFTLIQFDDFIGGGPDWYHVVHDNVLISTVSKCELSPRGNTALIDALGKSILQTGERLKAIEEAQRPGLVVFVILTDGKENASREFTKPKILEMVKHQQDVYKWKFIYLGADPDTFYEAHSLGMPSGTSAKFDKEEKTSGGIVLASAGVKRMRAAAFSGGDDNAIRSAGVFTDEEKAEIE